MTGNLIILNTLFRAELTAKETLFTARMTEGATNSVNDGFNYILDYILEGDTFDYVFDYYLTS